MNLQYYYWWFKSAVPPRICDDIVKYGLKHEDDVAITGGLGHDRDLKKQPLNKKELKNLEDKVKDHLAYKQLILSAVKSNYKPENIVNGLKVVAGHIKAKNWSMVDRIGGPSGDLEARGACPICHINLTGKDLRPREITFPCGVAGCPFEKNAN